MSDPKHSAETTSAVQPMRWLSFSDHDPDFLNLTYVYPVLSRRMQATDAPDLRATSPGTGYSPPPATVK